MLLILLAYFGGVLTILIPYILPILPFVFGRADQSFRRNGLPLLTGMAITFAVVASLGTVGGVDTDAEGLALSPTTGSISS